MLPVGLLLGRVLRDQLLVSILPERLDERFELRHGVLALPT
jgi:hypothetical protein